MDSDGDTEPDGEPDPDDGTAGYGMDGSGSGVRYSSTVVVVDTVGSTGLVVVGSSGLVFGSGWYGTVRTATDGTVRWTGQTVKLTGVD